MLANKLMSAALSGGAEDKLYVDSVFSTYLYTGNGATQTINNGIDLASKGGLVWVKSRSTTAGHNLYDTLRGPLNCLSTETTTSQQIFSNSITGFNSSGFSLGSFVQVNAPTNPYVSWTFRKSPRFFDIVTYTGNGVAGRQIPHELGIAPGMIVVKCLNTPGLDWEVYHRSLGSSKYIQLNLTNASTSGTSRWGGVDPSSSVFSVGADTRVNGTGGTYVAYLFAHDDSEDGIIQCGSFTAASGFATVDLGWEPQYVLFKRVNSSASNWFIFDAMRGMPVGSADATLYANLSNAESANSLLDPLATGFYAHGLSTNSEMIYLAIRRPNKPPKTGAEVYNAIARRGTGAIATVTGVGFAPDLILSDSRDFNFAGGAGVIDRLRGSSFALQTTTLSPEVNAVAGVVSIDQNGFTVGPDDTHAWFNLSGRYIHHFFKRAPEFMDVVCYTGTGVARTVPHGLGVAPELMIVKSRSAGGPGYEWICFHKDLGGANKYLFLNSTSATNTSATIWNNTNPTVTVVSTGTDSSVNGNGITYVAYLFASLPGISKVGSYTGNGTSQTIPCGFTTGARFILIKRTDATGDWYIWDTARGIISANDPHLSLNTTATEVTTDDSVDPEASGFIVNQNTATNINVSGGQYIFLSIA